MKISPIGINNRKILHSNSSKQNDNIVFKAKAGKIVGKITGAAAGAAAGGAIIGGGSLATGIAMLSGPVGWTALGVAYLIGGALAGGYIGDGIGDAIEDKINEKDDDEA